MSVDLILLRHLKPAPQWARALGRAGLLPAAHAAVARGDVEQVKPPGGKARNMFALTAKGRARLEIVRASA